MRIIDYTPQEMLIQIARASCLSTPHIYNQKHVTSCANKLKIRLRLDFMHNIVYSVFTCCCEGEKGLVLEPYDVIVKSARKLDLLDTEAYLAQGLKECMHEIIRANS